MIGARAVLRAVVRAVTVLVLLASLSLNAALVTASGVFSYVSGLAESLGAPTARRAQLHRVERAEVRARALSAQVRRMRGNGLRLSARLAKEADRSAALTLRVAGLEASQRVAFRGRVTTPRKAVGDTSRRIAGRMKRAALRNVATTVGEAMPGAGIPVIVAATSWELWDTCQTLKELQELDEALNPDGAIDASEVCGLRVPEVADLHRSIWSSGEAR